MSKKLKPKLSLATLRVKSFVTSLDKEAEKTVQGGRTPLHTKEGPKCWSLQTHTFSNPCTSWDESGRPLCGPTKVLCDR